MTDITDQTLREKFEAWLSEKPLHARYMHWSNTLNAYDYTGIQLAWEAYQAGGAELLEALEKAQAKNALVAGGIEATAKLHERIAKLESEVEKWKQEAEAWEQVAEKQLATAIELESRTVKLVDCDFGAVQHMSGGSTDYCHGFVDGTQNAIRSITAAGIKVDDE